MISRAQAVALVGPDRARWFVTSGRWQRPARGVLVAHAGPLSEEQLTWVALVGCGVDAVLGGIAAAKYDGFRLPSQLRPQLPDVLLPPGRKRVVQGCVVRRSQLLSEVDVHPQRDPKRTRLPRALVDAASWAPFDADARAIVAAGIQQRLVRAPDLLDVLGRLVNVRRRSLILATASAAVSGSHSVGELDAFRLCRAYGLPLPSRQASRRGPDGKRRWLDLFFDEYSLVVEIDGLWHMDVGSWWADLQRLNDHAAEGEAVLRFPAFAVREQPKQVATAIARALRRRGWQGSCRLLAS